MAKSKTELEKFKKLSGLMGKVVLSPMAERSNPASFTKIPTTIDIPASTTNILGPLFMKFLLLALFTRLRPFSPLYQTGMEK